MKAYNKSKRIKSNNHLDKYKVCIITYENCEQWVIPMKYVTYSVVKDTLLSLAINLVKVSTRTLFTDNYKDKDIEYKRLVKGEDISYIEFAEICYNYKNKKVYEVYCPKYIENNPYSFSSNNILQKNELCYFEDNYSCRLHIKWDTGKGIDITYNPYKEDTMEITKEKYEQYKDRIHNWNIEII